MMKTTDFYGTQISRLILGDNPFCGHSYIADEHSGGEMMDFYTAQTVIKTLFEAESHGINTYLALADPFIIRVLRQYRNEGGKMHIIFQSYPPVELEVNIHQMMGCDPIAIYHQGGTLDLMCEEEKTDELLKRLELIKASGVRAGLGTHVPETVVRADGEGWGMDFYLTCLYNARRTQRGQQSGFITGKPKELVFYPDDPPYMYEAIKKTKKPCVAFKIFAGGQVFSGKKPDETHAITESIFKEVYANIKPCDAACIGVFQKFSDQLKTDADIAKQVMNEL
jgi:hypothetical protein